MAHGYYTRCADVLNTDSRQTRTCAFSNRSHYHRYFFSFLARQRACIRSSYFDKIKCLHRCLVCGHISHGVSSAVGRMNAGRCMGLIVAHLVFLLRFPFYCFACLRRLCAPIIGTSTAAALRLFVHTTQRYAMRPHVHIGRHTLHPFTAWMGTIQGSQRQRRVRVGLSFVRHSLCVLLGDYSDVQMSGGGAFRSTRLTRLATTTLWYFCLV